MRWQEPLLAVAVTKAWPTRCGIRMQDLLVPCAKPYHDAPALRCVQVQQVYLVEVTDLEQYILDLERVWVVDRTTRKLSRCAVQRSPKLDEESAAYGGDVVLRIRCAWAQAMPRLDEYILQ